MTINNLNNQMARGYLAIEKQSTDKSLGITQINLVEKVVSAPLDRTARVLATSGVVDSIPKEVPKLDRESITILQEVQDSSVSKIQLAPDNVKKDEDKLIFNNCFACSCSDCNFSNLQVTVSNSDVIITYKTVAGVEYLKAHQKMLDNLKQFVSDKIKAPENRISISNGVETNPVYARKYPSATVNFSQIIISSEELISSDKIKEISYFVHSIKSEPIDGMIGLLTNGMLPALSQPVYDDLKMDEGQNIDDEEAKRMAAEEAMVVNAKIANMVEFVLVRQADKQVDKMTSKLLYSLV